MDHRREILSAVLRAAPPAILWILGGWVLGRSNGDPSHDLWISLLGLAFLIAGAAVLMFPLWRLSAEPIGSLFYPSDHAEQPAPQYSIPESKRKSGLFEEAIAGYEKIAAQYPGDVRPYLAMMEIAIVDLKDPERGSRFYDKGMSAITTPEGQESLSSFYLAHCSRLAGAPAWLKQKRGKAIAPKSHPGDSRAANNDLEHGRGTSETPEKGTLT